MKTKSILYREIIAVGSEMHVKHIRARYEDRIVEFMYVKRVAHTVTTQRL